MNFSNKTKLRKRQDSRFAANFDSSKLEAFQAELNQPTIKPAIESRQTPTEPHVE